MIVKSLKLFVILCKQLIVILDEVADDKFLLSVKLEKMEGSSLL